MKVWIEVEAGRAGSAGVGGGTGTAGEFAIYTGGCIGQKRVVGPAFGAGADIGALYAIIWTTGA